MRMNPLMSRAEDLFSSSRVRALRGRKRRENQWDLNWNKTNNKWKQHFHTHTDTLLDRVMRGLADVHHGVEDDRVSGWLHLVSAGDKHSKVNFLFNNKHIRPKAPHFFFLIRTVFWRSYFMKTSMMDLQTSTLTLSFWNMSRNGRKRSWDRATTNRSVKPPRSPIIWCLQKAKVLWRAGVCSPLRRGRRSCGSRWGSSWSLTAAAERNKLGVFTEERQAVWFHDNAMCWTRSCSPAGRHPQTPGRGSCVWWCQPERCWPHVSERNPGQTGIFNKPCLKKSETSDIHLKKHQSEHFSVGLSLGEPISRKWLKNTKRKKWLRAHK